jgi:hypothetical protein
MQLYRGTDSGKEFVPWTVNSGRADIPPPAIKVSGYTSN